MSIFIGRNIGEESEQWLLNRNVEFLAKALIEIQFIEPDLAFFQKNTEGKKHWLITSKWAAKWLQLNHTVVGLQSSDSVFCLSEKQAEIINGFSDNVFVAPHKNLNSLSSLVQQKEKNGGGIYLKGNYSVQTKGLETVDVEVYKNKLACPIIDGVFDAYLFFSPSGIESFTKGGNKIRGSVLVVVIGETTAKKAKAVFSNEILVSNEQSELATIKRAVQELAE